MPLSPEQDKAVDAFLRRQGQEPGKPPKEPEEGTTTGNFMRGVGQGLLGYVEAPAQWAEHGIRMIPGEEKFKMPLHDWAAGYRRRAESSPAGIAGEVAGSIAPMFIPVGGWLGGLARAAGGAEDVARVGGAARAAGALGLAPAEAANPAAAAVRGAGTMARAIPGVRTASQINRPSLVGQVGQLARDYPKTAFALKSGAIADLAQPADDNDFARQMASRFALGAGLGGIASQYMRMLKPSDYLPELTSARRSVTRTIPREVEAKYEPELGSRRAAYYRPRPVSEPVRLKQRQPGQGRYRTTEPESDIERRLTPEGAKRQLEDLRRGLGRSRHAYWLSRLMSIPGYTLGHAGAHALGFPFWARHGLAHLLGLGGRRLGYAAAGRTSPYFEQAIQGASPGMVGAAASQAPNVPYYGWEALTGGPDEDQGD